MAGINSGRRQSRKIVTTSAWAASSDLTPVNLHRDGLITEVGIRAEITTAALTATAVADGLKRVIQNLKIQGDGGRSYLGLSGEQAARLLSYMNDLDFGTPMMDSKMPEVADTALSHFTWVFHPGSNPKDPFDLSACIPAKHLSTLQVLLTTTANGVVDAAAAIASGTYKYWINEVLDYKIPPHQYDGQGRFVNGMMTPIGSTFSWANDANYSDYSKDIDVPGGAWLRRAVFLCQDETATVPVRKDDEVTGVKLKLAKVGLAPIELSIQDLKVMAAKRSRFPGQIMNAALGAVTTRPGWEFEQVLPAGLFVIDFRDIFDPRWGLDLTNYQSGDVKIGLTVENRAAGDDTIIYWDQLIPMESQYIG